MKQTRGMQRLCPLRSEWSGLSSVWTDAFFISSRCTFVHLIELIYHYEPCSTMKVINKWSQSLSVVICGVQCCWCGLCVSGFESERSASARRTISSAWSAADSRLFVKVFRCLSLWTQSAFVFQSLGLTVILQVIKLDLCFQTVQDADKLPSKILSACQWGWKTSCHHHELKECQTNIWKKKKFFG